MRITLLIIIWGLGLISFKDQNNQREQKRDSFKDQYNHLLESQNGYKDFKFGMTTEQINALNILSLPPKSQQYIATEYQNAEVTYVAYFDLEQFEYLRNNGYAYYLNKPIKYICLLFYENKLFKIRLHFFGNDKDNNAYILDTTNSFYNVPTSINGTRKYGQLNSINVIYQGTSEENGTNTTIIFERRNVENLIKSNLTYNEENLGKYNNPKIYALIIGINDYSHTDSKPNNLNDCKSDADLFYSFLTSPQGGSISPNQIVLLEDNLATKKNILSTADRLFALATPYDEVIFYFSGHGGPLVFLTYDEILLHKEIKSILYNRCKAKIKLVLADACYAGTWDKKFSMSTKDLTPEQAQALMNQSIANENPGTILFMAAANDETSIDDPELKQGLFTYFLIEGLKGSADTNYDNFITVLELYEYTKSNVSKRAAEKYFHSQNPVINGHFDPATVLAVR